MKTKGLRMYFLENTNICGWYIIVDASFNCHFDKMVIIDKRRYRFTDENDFNKFISETTAKNIGIYTLSDWIRLKRINNF